MEAIKILSAWPKLTQACGRAADGWQRFASANPKQKIRYLGRLFHLSLLLPAAFVVYIGLTILNFFRAVRIGTLNAKSRLTIMVSYLEPYLRDLQLNGIRDPFVIVINPGKCPNEQLSKMYGRVVWLLDDRYPWLRAIFTVALNTLISNSRLEARLRGDYTAKFTRAWNNVGPVMRFTAQELPAGRLLVAKMGVPSDTGYICFALRDNAYYQQFLTVEAQARHPNPEAGEDTYIRNPPLKNYLPMAAECARRGLYVLRIGQIVGEPLPRDLDPKIIDYAMQYRTPFGDIYLIATCKFLVTGGTGLLWIASAFNRPVIMTDSYCMQVRPMRRGDLFIPKKLWLASEKRFLSFREMLDAGMHYTYESNCRRDGLELLHNTPEEITAAAAEMLERVEGRWRVTEEDEELQRRFQALYVPEHYGYGLPGRIGAEFLRQNRDLLDG